MISLADLSRMSLLTCILLGTFFVRVNSQHPAFAPSHENRSFISHENRSLKPSFLSHQKIALRNLADASISESCKTAVDDSTSCRESFSNAVKANCKGTEDIFSHYTVHGTAGAPSWIRGQSDLTGSTNHVRTLLEKEFTKDNAIAWVKTYAKDYWVWYIFLGLGLIWIIVGLIWWPGLCSSHCRRCLGKCFCKKCCNQRIRARPVSTVTRTKYCLFLWWFVVTSVVLLVFVGLAIFDSVQLYKVSANTQCVVNKVSYVTVLGDSHYKSASKFNGVASLPQMLNAAAGNSTKAAADVTHQSKELKEFKISFRKDHIESYIAVLKKNYDELSLFPPRDFKGFDGTTTISSPQPLYCLQCALAKNPIPLYIKSKSIVTSGGAYEKGMDGVISFTNELANEFSLAADDYRGVDVGVNSQKIINDLLTMFDLSFWKYSNLINWSVLGFFLIGPVFTFVVWVVGLVLYSYLWTRYSKQKTTNHKQLRNWFGCLCWFFTLCGILVLVVGVLSLMAAQPVSEGCEFAYNDLMTDNKFMEYDAIKSKFTNPDGITTVTDECMTTNGKGDLKKALEAYSKIKVPDSLSDLGDQYMKKFDLGRKLMQDSFQNNYTDANDILHNLGLVVLLGSYDTKGFSEGDFFYAADKLALYGGLAPDDKKTLTPAQIAIVEGRQNLIKKEASDAFKRFEFKDRTGVKIRPTPPAVPSPIEVLGTKGLLDWLKNVLGPSCASKLCPGAAGCIPSDGSRIIKVKDPTSNDLNLKYIIDALPNAKFKSDFFDPCLSSNPDLVTLQWIMSFNLYQHRVKAARAATKDSPFYTITAGPPISYPPISYPDFATLVKNRWKKIYSFVDTTKALDDAQIAIKDKVIKPLDIFVDSLPWNCRILYEQLKSVTDLLCYNATYDIGRLGMSWIMLALGLFILSILTWKIFHYFADLRYDDKHYGTPEAFLKMSQEGRLEELKICGQLQNVAEVKDQYGNSGLHLAAYHRNPDCCSYLLTQGLSPDENNQALYSPMHIAVVAGDNETVKRFIEAGADMRQYNYFGDTPLHSAAMAGDKTIIETLLEAEEKGSPAPLNLKEESASRTAERVGKAEIAKRLGDFFSESSIRSFSSFMDNPATPRADGVGFRPVQIMTKPSIFSDDNS